jgi:tellurite resistance protein TerC
MRCFILVVSTLASITACEDLDASCHATPEHLGASSGTMLLQRPSVHVEQVDIDHGQHHALARQTPSERPTLEGTSLLELSPSMDTLKSGDALETETISVLGSGAWSRWTVSPRRVHKIRGPHHFWTSVVVFDWCLFGSAIIIFFLLHMLVLGRMEEKGWHLAVLFIWLVIGCSYNMIIWARFGSNAGISWFAGYLLEFIFLVENIFIFHIIMDAFKIPSIKLTRKALHVVVWGQIMFEMIFFMGLAAWLRTFKALPYMLGVWLICCGFLAARGAPSMETDIMETKPCRALTALLGDRLSHVFENDGDCLLRDNSGRMQVSLLGLVVFVLLTADFLLEIDVVLTKIEEIPNPYIAFTSSAVAAFSIPELFFLSKGLLKRFVLLKYGIGFVLMLFGAQMLLSSIYILRPIVACCIIIGVLIACVLLSLLDSVCGYTARADGHVGPALLEVGQGEAHGAARQASHGPFEAKSLARDAESAPEAVKTPEPALNEE